MPDKPEKTDEEIAAAVQAGDSEAFGVLMRRHGPRLLAYAEAFLHDRDAAEDVVEETFIKAYRKMQSFDTGRRFASWLFRIAHNEAVNAIVKTQKEKVVSDWDWDLFALIEAPEHSDDRAERQEIEKMMQAALARLEMKYREPLVLYYMQEMEYKEISHVLGLPVSTVGVRISRGRQRLRDLYIQEESGQNEK